MSETRKSARTTRKKSPVTQYIRHGVQLLAFFLFPGLFISVFTALGDIVKAAVSGTFSLQAQSSQILLLIAIFPITVIWGRFFCGYLCSFGAMGDLLHFLAVRLHIPQIKVPEGVEKVLSKIKYVIFVLILLFSWILGMKIADSLNPWSAFGMLTALNFQMILSTGTASIQNFFESWNRSVFVIE
ncbi:MAG: 4Fe-4S binding protein [Eubacterium sp.]|nr:4Fe-4S binding protein [Eubacterium sp.]